ncbi:hypothetical protein E2562_025131 [Oryza meyeriana var. granulata]|uniref:AP180 N-terminal homology (ANTH) domain-containing protein n=1 Tax=Oryza meyeriana var. granulata TaxID=110450 RepID=A0A6G1CIK2_9ORYZ|nr:hypothetical protein E2562_025131 [Oryza meyeriana var. granulata]
MKDRRSLLLVRVRPRGAWHHRELEAAVIRATSHEDRWVDYRRAGRVFRWAGTSPALSPPIMWALARRARLTRCWAMALKALMEDIDGDDSDHCTVRLDRRTKLHYLLELLLQIRPYVYGMEVPLVLEAMDCALIEIFQVYSGICTGVARFLVGAPGPTRPRPRKSTATAGIKVLWRAAEQRAQLSSYFELCRSLGVVNARRLPAFERLSDEDVRNLERLLRRDADEEVVEGAGSSPPIDPTDTGLVASSAVAATRTEWVAPSRAGGGGDPRDEPHRLPERQAGVQVAAHVSDAIAAHHVAARAPREADAVLGRGAQGPHGGARRAPPLGRLPTSLNRTFKSP